MRIGFFTDTYTPQINGVVTSIRLFKKALEQRDHDVYVFAPTPDHPEDEADTFRFKSMPFVFQPEMRFASPVSIEALRRLDEVDLDVIHSHDPFAIGLFGLAFARRHRIPYVHTYHTLYPEYVHYVWETRLTKKLAERLSRDFCQACDSIVAPSTKVENYLRRWGVTVPIEVIPTGIDSTRYSTADPERAAALRDRLLLEESDRIAIFVGRLGREKNVETLIRALWHCTCPDTVLVIVGDGPHRDALEELAEELGVSTRVRFAGYLQRDDVIAAYHIAQALVFASTTETQGLVVAEAMAAGLPVIAIEDEALQDFVRQDENGVVVHGNPEAFADAMDLLMNDEELRARLSKEARATAEAVDIANQAALLEAHYVRAIRAHDPRSRRLFRLPASFRW